MGAGDFGGELTWGTFSFPNSRFSNSVDHEVRNIFVSMYEVVPGVATHLARMTCQRSGEPYADFYLIMVEVASWVATWYVYLLRIVETATLVQIRKVEYSDFAGPSFHRCPADNG
jgi:hypothetical protein